MCYSALVDVMEKRSTILSLLCLPQYDAFSWLNGEISELRREGRAPRMSYAGFCRLVMSMTGKIWRFKYV